jgi:hypothetical protein
MADYLGITTKIAQGLGIPKSTISTWIAKGIITNPDRLLPSCKEILDHYKTRIDDLESRQLAQEGDRLYQQKVRLATAQADKEEIELAIAKGELHNSQEMLKALYNTLGFFKSTLTSWRSRISPQLINQNNLGDIEDILEVNINEALSELAKGLEELENASDRPDTDIQNEYLPDIEEGF